MRQKLADFHIHSNYSFDGVLSPSEIIESAKHVNAEWVSITDHNTLQGVRDLWDSVGADLTDPFIEVDGVKILSGVEVTCRVGKVSNKAKNTSKIHVLVYGADLSNDSPLMRLMKIKHENDKDVDFGVLKYLWEMRTNTTLKESAVRDFIRAKREINPGYNTISSRDDIYNFLQEQGVTIAKSYRDFTNMIMEVPQIKRLNIEVEDLIRIAHESGGIVILAHPSLNLIRTSYPESLIKHLLECGIDGFENEYVGRDKKFTHLIDDMVRQKHCLKRNIYTGGSDTHSLANGNTIGSTFENNITVESQLPLITEAKKLSEARKSGIMTHRSYDTEGKDIDRLIAEYQSHAKEVETNEDKKVHKHYDATPKEVKKRNKKRKKKQNADERSSRKKFKDAHPEFVQTSEIDEDEMPYDEYIAMMERRYGKANSAIHLEEMDPDK